MNKPNDKPLSSEPLAGSGPDNVTPETPICPSKKVPCGYWTDKGCMIDVCWMDGDSSDSEARKE